MDYTQRIQQAIEGHLKALDALDETFFVLVQKASEEIISSFLQGGKLLACGNGGSAADAQHIVTELVIRLDSSDIRRALPALALTTNTSLITAAGNDLGFDNIFTRQVEAFGQEGDVLLAISTSGNSANVIEAVRKASEIQLKTIGLLGFDGGKLKELVDFPLIVPGADTMRIQEIHIMVGHIICDIVASRIKSLG